MLNHSSKYSDLTSEQYEGFGRLFVEWSNIEFLLRLILSRLLFTPEFLGRTYSDGLNADRLETGIRNALDIHQFRYGYQIVPEEQVTTLRSLLKDVKKSRILRNKFAHFLWMRISDKEISGHRMSGKPPPKKGDNDSVRIAVVDLNEAHQKSYELVDKLRKLLLELPEILEEQSLELVRATVKSSKQTCDLPPIAVPVEKKSEGKM